MKREAKTVKMDETTDNVINFEDAKEHRLALDGKGPTEEDWLSKLEVGIIFLSKLKNTKELILNPYMIVEHKSNSSNLEWRMPDKQQVNIWVNTLEFSRQMKLMDILGKVELGDTNSITNGRTNDTSND